MYESYDRKQWDYTSNIMCITANAFSGKKIPLSNFTPYPQAIRETNTDNVLNYIDGEQLQKMIK